MSETPTTVDQAVAEGGAYEVLRRRLEKQGEKLQGLAEGLNAQRLEEFGSSRLEVIGRLRVRTEHNCVARDIAQVGELLLFGYNVFLGLKKETRVEDVFSLYRLVKHDEAWDVEPVPLAGSFLAEDSFAQDFRELYAYYKNTRLLQLARREGWLLASFQIGERLGDVRVFRWRVAPDGSTQYVDNRGERDIAPPPAWDFEWTACTREDMVEGRHPHMNILDTVFVETVGGDLTIKIENNTQDGLGIYREPVDDQTQSLDDARIEYARLGALILLRVLPYRETVWRHLVYNTLTREVRRIDAIGQSCVQLPEDHGIVFPGGYLLPSGEYKTFERSMAGMHFARSIRSPNGEDVLYVFYEPEHGRVALFTYNMIQRALQTPILGHGYARLDDGRMVVFSSESDEPTRVHPMQVWQTPFASEEHAAAAPPRTSFMGRIGNAPLVRGISDLMALRREIAADSVSAQRYGQLVQDARRLFDLHHWLEDSHCADLAPLLREIAQTGAAVLDEFAKVESIRQQSDAALREARTRQAELLADATPERCESIDDYTARLNALTRQRGHLLTIRDYRYIDVAEIDALEGALRERHDALSQATAAFLGEEAALAPLKARLADLDAKAQAATGAGALKPVIEAMEALSADLDMLSSLMAGLKIDDAAERTRVVEAISALYAGLNQAKARAAQRRRQLGSAEAVAQFGAQFQLFGQSVTAALGASSDPERCDEQMARILVQLEELETQFGEHEEFLQDILAKREEVLEAFESHRQALVDERQRKAQAVQDAALRILEGFSRRTARFTDPDELNAFFAGDPLILKLRELIERLRALHDSVKADDVEARLKAARDQAVRGLRDKTDLFEAGGEVIKLGPRHRFSVNTQPLDLTLLPRGEQLALHLTGTDYFAPIEDPALDALRPYWSVSLASESDELYRGEFLAAEVLAAAERSEDGFDLAALRAALGEGEALDRHVRAFAAPRYKDGYEKGIHDHDAARILRAWLPLRESAGTLAHPPAARALGMLAWEALQKEPDVALWPLRARQRRMLRESLGAREAGAALIRDVRARLKAFVEQRGLAPLSAEIERAAEYVVDELAAEHPQFAVSRYAGRLLEQLKAALSHGGRWEDLESALRELGPRMDARYALSAEWLGALFATREAPPEGWRDYLPEAAALVLVDHHIPIRYSEAELRAEVDGLLGQHPRIEDGRLVFGVDELALRLQRHRSEFLPGLAAFQQARHALLERERRTLKLSEFQPRPLASFVRNKLINEVYLPIIGDNLAKQMGTVGESKRSDLMGLLMLISPPGYGKTTLMEYVAHRLGLIFMKINGPALGHEVRSLDPAQAPDATSRQELEKLNLALEMGNNVMLYVDDIQHTHPEFLQKFISLCDGTRRIEGVWRGRTRTYDLRGKKFCVVMAGNPYTESGEVFRIPDMLANRADVYNLGDVLGGRQDVFLLSYVENSLTANPVLAPLATRRLDDLYRIIDKVEGKPFSTNDLSHHYSAAELGEIEGVLRRMMELREVVFRVNMQYIASAAQADAYRTEPPFKLQGSYRNMNKLAEKVSAVMNDSERDQLIRDHYQGESQLLTTGAEENLLKLGELLGTHTEEEAARWAQIKRDYARNKAIGGADADTATRVVAQLRDLADGVNRLGERAAQAADAGNEAHWQALLEVLTRILDEQALARTFNRDTATESAMWLGGLRNALELGFKPLVQGMEKRAEQHDALNVILREIARRMGGGKAG
ncbi:DNA repair ATPase [Pseudomarimonas salicorniae]|uniref:DNA repair ATPase n=1 Tax=Pseudomarimonas salicorniae TaxID=2933270 RepID=A0ABT0GLX7_9GAMM|nr:DNA repair ATPase [Lysobacter sp. CAU 1642]MCK7595549.1 DNA repair ATPase [Lysobacter sp. CAU 1642]